MGKWIVEGEPVTLREARGNLEHRARLAGQEASDRVMMELHRQAPDADECPECGETRHASWTRCACTEKAREEAEAAYLAEHFPASAAAAWQLVDVPARFREKTLDAFKPREGAAEALEACRNYAEAFERGKTGDGLFLFGGFGTGKTHLVIATARRIVERTLTDVVITTADELVAQHQDSDFDAEPIQRAIRAEILVLDDLGQGRATDFRRDTIYRVVAGRHEELRPTLLTSNLGTAQLRELYGGALVSRLWEMAEGVPVTASDYRAGAA